MSRYFTETLASLEPYVPGEQLKIKDLVKLNANENPYPPAPVLPLRWRPWYRGCGSTRI